MTKEENSSAYLKFQEKIRTSELKIGIIGLGYAGLPLAIGFIKQGLDVIGIDKDKKKIDKLNKRESYIPYLSDQQLKNSLSDKFNASSDYKLLKKVDAIVICVPTPLSKTRTPDLTFIISVINKLRNVAKSNQLIILQSTTYPGTTMELLCPKFKSKGFQIGKNLFIGYAPERIDPGNKNYNLRNTPKIVSGVTSECKKRVKTLFELIVDNVIAVSNTTTAETVKLHENTFRQLNIALANELAIMCDHIGIDAWEVINAAATKPFAFMAHYPGPGVGGDCIPVVPHFMSWKLKEYGYENKLIESSHEINLLIRHHVCQKVSDALNEHEKSIKGSKILILGIAYKANSSDTRESASIDVFRMLKNKGAEIDYIDPFVVKVLIEDTEYRSLSWNKKTIETADCVVILTNHSLFTNKPLWDFAKIIVDTRNIAPYKQNVYKLGVGING